jgi:hypothetical protein
VLARLVANLIAMAANNVVGKPLTSRQLALKWTDQQRRTTMKKTIDIKKLVEKANIALTMDFLSQEHKAGIASLLEVALHETGSYNGFRYLGMYKEGDDWKYPAEYNREYFMPRKKA